MQPSMLRIRSRTAIKGSYRHGFLRVSHLAAFDCSMLFYSQSLLQCHIMQALQFLMQLILSNVAGQAVQHISPVRVINPFKCLPSHEQCVSNCQARMG